MGFTKSRIISRSAPMKGVKAIGLAPYSANDLPLNTATGIIDIPNSMNGLIARIEVKATGNNIVETGTFDEATRTMEYVGVNTFFIAGNDDTLRREVQTDSGILKTVFIEDYNGKVYVLGSQNGCDIMTIAGGSDMQGFMLTINSKEKDLMYTLTGAGLTEYRSSILPTV